VIDPIEGVGRLLASARRPVVFTGAGVSTESGIPDFRSPGGVWDRFDPREMTYQNFLGSETARRKYWEIGRQSYALMRTAEPNAAHRALAELHRLERLDCCVTQNVDNLHQRGGLPEDKVIELHGNATRARCLDCGRGYSRDEVQRWLDDGVALPVCSACGGIVKPHTILFGEPMPARAVEEAERRARAADVFVVVGSSLVVYPAAYMPAHAKHAGAALVIVNLSPTPCDTQADFVIRGRAGEVLDAIVGRVRSLL
jgi:NAD-dependent protein deacetylase/lipoamidase